ncbi:MAG: DNA-protecting protein DprA, partial [Candidatus Magasanikbacteria bacterium]|nr:DNA-protecting protein DprA [Candidatus Magasanikbacteria bacterium]
MKADILFSYFPKITFQRYKKLVAEAGSLDAAWQGNKNIFLAAGWQPELVDEFFAWKKTVNTKKLDEILRQEHITAIPYGDEHYPTLLQELYDPPLCLFVRGTLPTHTNTTVGVVGTRAYTPYGKQVVDAYIPPLVEAGACIVSGLAIGIDSLAHKKTLDHGGVTLGVLGSGVNKTHVFPKENSRLGEDIIAQGGALISEYPPYTLPTVYSFPKRNRIIAGLSRATLIIEAGEKSG